MVSSKWSVASGADRLRLSGEESSELGMWNVEL
jgi:hypothetical protein